MPCYVAVLHRIPVKFGDSLPASVHVHARTGNLVPILSALLFLFQERNNADVNLALIVCNHSYKRVGQVACPSTQ